MGRWPVFDGASCCAVGLALWECVGSLPVVQIDKRQVCLGSEIQRNVLKHSSPPEKKIMGHCTSFFLV